MSNGWHYLYAIEHPDGFQKVGRATDPMKRLPGVQTGCPYELEMWLIIRHLDEYDDEPFEDRVHEALAEYQWRGEWFDATRADVEAAIFACSDHDESDIISYGEYVEKQRRERDKRRRAKGIRYARGERGDVL